MLTRQEIKSLQSQRDYPSVSILAPTHRTSPANQQDPIKVKNLVAKAMERLHGEFKKREVAAVVKNLQALVKSVDWEHTLNGLALFASGQQSAVVTLPFSVKPRTIIDETFATRDLVYAFNRATPYRVLVLGHATRLFDAWNTTLDERAKPFPMTHTGAGGKSKLPGGKGINRSAARDDAMRKYFRAVDDALAPLQKQNPLPLIAVGVERNLAFFREVTRHADSLIGLLAGNHEATAPDKLGKLVWPVYETGATSRRTEALVQLDQAVSAHTHASGIAQVWREAAGAMVRTLLVEKDFKYSTDVSPDGQVLLPHTGGKGSLDDAVDEIIERVLATGGEVFFFAPGDLDVHQKIAAVLRR